VVCLLYLLFFFFFFFYFFLLIFYFNFFFSLSPLTRPSIATVQSGWALGWACPCMCAPWIPAGVYRSE
jgi:hypothetical protein